MEAPLPARDRAAARERASRVTLLTSEAYVQSLSRMAVNRGRDIMLADLLNHTGLLSWISVIEPMKATEVHLSRFHAADYIKAIKDNDPAEVNTDHHSDYDTDSKSSGIEARKRQRRWLSNSNQDPEALETLLDDFGLTDDCAMFPGVFDYACRIAGASMQAADLLCRGSCDIAINWGGGRHHASKDKASGYCFVNDVVLAVLHLRRRFRRVLYVDIDVHHGDGVEEAFYYDSSVMTISIHHEAPGFFPNKHTAKNVGEGDGMYSALNLPLKAGATDESFIGLFEKVFTLSLESFKPDAVVMCCGCDSLGGDPLGKLNLSTRGISQAVKHASDQCVSKHMPLLLLGGGGYNPSTTARAWACATAAAAGEYVESHILPEFVPEPCHYFAQHGPDFSMHPIINQSYCLTDKNTPEHYHRLYTHAKRVLFKYRTKASSPSSTIFNAAFLHNCSTFTASSSSSNVVVPNIAGGGGAEEEEEEEGIDRLHGMCDDEQVEEGSSVQFRVVAPQGRVLVPQGSRRKRDAFDFDE